MQHVTTYVCACLLAFIWNSLSLLQLFLPKCSKNVITSVGNVVVIYDVMVHRI